MNNDLLERVKQLSTPIDFKDLKKRGLIRQVGKSYYIKDMDDIENLPQEVQEKITSTTPGKHGIKLTFLKATKYQNDLAQKISELKK